MTTLASSTVLLEDDAEVVGEFFYSRGSTDGLPIVVPTVERVARILDGIDRDPQESLGKVPPLNGEATIEKVAINAVMAGCPPEVLPIIVTAMECMLEPEWELEAVQPTTMALGPMVVVNGPVRHRAGVHCGAGSLGPGRRANATIGRAIRLLLINLGGGIAGDIDRSTQGFPGKYTFAWGENEEDSAWEPFHVSRGFDADQSVVTVVAVSSSTNVSDSTDDAADLLKTWSGGLTNPSTANVIDPHSTPVLAVNPLHSQILASAGYDRRRFQEHIWRTSRVPIESLSARRTHLRRAYGEEHLLIDGMVPFTNDPANVLVAVTGGMQGNHSTYMQNGFYGRAISKRVRGIKSGVTACD
jgi:hypothetical protein